MLVVLYSERAAATFSGGATMVTVFLSYSRDDGRQLAVLAEDIKSLGHQAWLDQELTGGQRWWDHILQEIRECDAFVSAVSTSSMDSRACTAEYEYALALGKPILPVMVERGVADSLMPPHLAELHRVDYISGDKAAFASLNRALAALPPPPPLPDPLPDSPPVPASYLYDLKTEINASGEMAPATQTDLVRELRERLRNGHNHADLRSLVRQFRARDDLLVRTEQELAAFEATLTEAAASPRPAEEVPMPQAAPAPPAPAPVGMAPASLIQSGSTPNLTGQVSLAWWIAPILAGLIGGAIAFFAVRGTNPDTARNMLITGVVMSVVWAFLLA